MIRAANLLVGLTFYGISLAMMVRADLGLDPWDVFHQGLSLRTGWSMGTATAVVGVGVLLAWLPLRNRPGIGTVANVIVIAVTLDLALAVIDAPTGLPARIALLVGGVLLNALATVLYIGAGLGAGPRDGLMTGLVARTGRSVRLVRTSIELSVLVIGAVLGGSVGVGTVLYAVSIGPLVQLILRHMPSRLLAVDFGAPARDDDATPPVDSTVSGTDQVPNPPLATMIECPNQVSGRRPPIPTC